MSWLSRGGALAALAVGGAVVAGTGPRGLALLAAFFVTSSLLTARAGRDPRERGGRTARQVVANGGVAAIVALSGWPAALAGAVAAATADTWATEIGRRARGDPRLITTWVPVPSGTSGGVTALGTAGGAAGALMIAGLGAGLWNWGIIQGGAVLRAGALGMVADSFLGAALQARWRCPQCGREHERRDAACHDRLVHARGIRWLDNDAVNLAATLVGAGGAVAFVRWWG